jgi:L-ascorbate metabolism protein UlaG (beta-lactamase superfamily)
VLDFNGLKVHWDGHGAVRVNDQGFTVAVDPFSEVCPDFEADIVLVTGGSDETHFDKEMLDSICNNRSCVVLPESLNGQEVPCIDVEYIKEGETIDVYNVEIEAVPARSKREVSELGYCFTMAGNTFYVSGDTSLIDEAFELEGLVDVAFLPCDGVSLELEEIVKLAVRIKPEVVVPYLYGDPLLGTVDIRALQAELEDRSIRCELLESEGIK